MKLDQTKTAVLDEALTRYAVELRELGQDLAATTLAYTHSIHRTWRQVLGMLPIPEGAAVLDVGTGLGMLPLELAANAALEIKAIDWESQFIGHAEVLQARLEAKRLFVAGSDLEFSTGDARKMDFADHSFDFIFVREVLQFIPDPVAALEEVRRLLRPGGFVCLGDVDDQLRITWPPPSPHLTRLVDAVSELQHTRGGDREIGRKLTTFLRAAGLGVNSVVVIPEAQHRVVRPDDAERALVIDQLKVARPLVLAEGMLDAAQFDADFEEFQRDDPFEEFRLSARIIVLAQRPFDS